MQIVYWVLVIMAKYWWVFGGLFAAAVLARLFSTVIHFQ